MEITAEHIQQSEIFTKNQNRLDHNLNKMKSSLKEFAACLKDIKDNECWKLRDNRYESFDDFVKKELGIAKSRAYQIMAAQDIKLALCDAAKDMPEISTIVENLNEGQLRELANVEPAKAIEVIVHVAKEGKITAKKFKAKVSPVEVKPITESAETSPIQIVCPNCNHSF